MAQRDDSGLHCQNCSISELCLPYSLNSHELQELDDIIERKRPYQKNQSVFQAGHPLKCLYAVRSGSFKTYIVTEDGQEQITGFHLPGDILGFDGLLEKQHESYAQSLETSMVCEIPYQTLDGLSGQFPALRRQVMRLMSHEIQADQEFRMLLNKRSADERLAYFLANLSQRFGQRGFSPNQFRLTMTRRDIGNYLGLTVETISRLLTRFQQDGFIDVEGKLIVIKDHERMQDLIHAPLAAQA